MGKYQIPNTKGAISSARTHSATKKQTECMKDLNAENVD